MIKSTIRKELEEGAPLSDYSESSFINKQGTIIQAKDLFFLGNGYNSSVWKLNINGRTLAIKVFFSDCLFWSLSYDTFEAMKPLHLKRTLKPLDAFYEQTNKKIDYYKLDAYSMDYISEGKKSSILDIPTSVLLENIRLQEEDITVLAENAIEMRDSTIDNTILSDRNEFFISDFDSFYVNKKLTSKELLERNKVSYHWVIKESFLAELELLFDCFEYNRMTNIFFNILKGRPQEVDIYERLEEALSGYDTPKEYFLSFRK